MGEGSVLLNWDISLWGSQVSISLMLRINRGERRVMKHVPKTTPTTHINGGKFKGCRGIQVFGKRGEKGALDASREGVPTPNTHKEEEPCCEGSRLPGPLY